MDETALFKHLFMTDLFHPIPQGKRQLLCIHLLQDDHDLWLLDEAATSLDDKNRHHLEERIAGFPAIGGAVIASTHSDLAQNLVSQIITLEKRDFS